MRSSRFYQYMNDNEKDPLNLLKKKSVTSLNIKI